MTITKQERKLIIKNIIDLKRSIAACERLIEENYVLKKFEPEKCQRAINNYRQMIAEDQAKISEWERHLSK